MQVYLTLALFCASLTQEMLETAYEIFKKQGQYFDALRVALRMNRTENITDLLKSCSDPLVRKQMCVLLGRHRVNYEVDESEIDGDDVEKLNELIGNEHLSEQFLKLAQDLDVMDPKTPEDIYKTICLKREDSVVDETLVVRKSIPREPIWPVPLSTLSSMPDSGKTSS